MHYSEKYKEHIKYTFIALYKVFLHNTAINAYFDLHQKQKWEISLNYLMEEIIEKVVI